MIPLLNSQGAGWGFSLDFVVVVVIVLVVVGSVSMTLFHFNLCLLDFLCLLVPCLHSQGVLWGSSLGSVSIFIIGIVAFGSVSRTLFLRVCVFNYMRRNVSNCGNTWQLDVFCLRLIARATLLPRNVVCGLSYSTHCFGNGGQVLKTYDFIRIVVHLRCFRTPK